MFCCITRSIAPGRQSNAWHSSAPTVIVVSGVETNTSPAVVKTPVLPSKLALTFFNLALSAADNSTYVVPAPAHPLIAAAKLVKAAASLAPFNTLPGVDPIELTKVNLTPPTVISSVATTEEKLIVLVCSTLLDEYTLYPAKFPAYPFFKAKSARLNQSCATV